MSRNWVIWIFVAFAAGVAAILVSRGSQFTVSALQDQRDQQMSSKLDDDLQAVVNCLGSRQVTIQRSAGADSYDPTRNAFIAQLNVTVPYGQAWKGSAKQLTVSWADHRSSSNRSDMRECISFNRLVVDSCCRAAPTDPLPSNPVCKVLAACGSTQWE